MARGPVPRRPRPVPRLVPLVPAGRGQRPGARTLPQGADTRLHPRRQRTQDVQVAGQRDLADRGRREPRRRDPAHVGLDGGLPRGPSAVRRDPRPRRRSLSQGSQHVPLPAGQPEGVRPPHGPGAVRQHERTGSVGSAATRSGSKALDPRLRRPSVPRRLPRAAPVLCRHPVVVLPGHHQGPAVHVPEEPPRTARGADGAVPVGRCADATDGAGAVLHGRGDMAAPGDAPRRRVAAGLERSRPGVPRGPRPERRPALARALGAVHQAARGGLQGPGDRTPGEVDRHRPRGPRDHRRRRPRDHRVPAVLR